MWRIDGKTATLDHPRLTGVVDLTRPNEGLHDLRLDGSALAASAGDSIQILGVDTRCESGSATPQLADCYVRGCDLVAAYAEAASRKFRPQIYWRLIQDVDAGGIGLETIVSIETELLDSRPAAATLTSLPAAESLFRSSEQADFQPIEPGPLAEGRQSGSGLKANLYLLRLAGGMHSYVEMATRSDFTKVELSRPDTGLVRLQFQLFHEHLEKGVIRRARVRGMFVRPERDMETAVACYRDFLESPLPLTT